MRRPARAIRPCRPAPSKRFSSRVAAHTRRQPQCAHRVEKIAFDRDLAATKLAPNIPVGRNFRLRCATPFYVAAKHGDVELMQLLVGHGANPKMPTVAGRTPLMAAGAGILDGESPDCSPACRRPTGRSREDDARNRQRRGCRRRLGGPALEGDAARPSAGILSISWPTTARTMPARCRPPEDSLATCAGTGATALHGAAMRGADAIVQFLVDQGAKIDARNSLGWTHLMCAEGIFVANTLKDWPRRSRSSGR